MIKESKGYSLGFYLLGILERCLLFSCHFLFVQNCLLLFFPPNFLDKDDTNGRGHICCLMLDKLPFC